MRCTHDSTFLGGIQHIAEVHSLPLDGELQRLERATRFALPDWCDLLIGPFEARFLDMLVSMVGARRVLEVGTFTGYSTLVLARALPDDGVIVTCDNFSVDQRAESLARRAFADSKHGHKVSLLVGEARDILAQIEPAFDVIFIDADEANYIDYYECILDRALLSRHNGLLILDNSFWGSGPDRSPGRPVDWVDRWAYGVADFTTRIASDYRVEQVLLRDGLTLVRHARASGDAGTSPLPGGTA